MRALAWMLAGLLFGIAGVAGGAGVARVEHPMERLHRVRHDAVRQLDEAAGRTGEMLDDATATVLERARLGAGRLIQAGAALPGDFRQAYEAVVATLDSLGRCLAIGAASSPLGPAGPRTAPADADGSCR